MEKGDERDPAGVGVGPVLFLVFIDVQEEGLRSDVLKFADDTKIFRRVDSEVDKDVLQRDLDRLVQWSEVWQMRFNVDKCKVMHLGRGNLGGNYLMNGGNLGVVDEERSWSKNHERFESISTLCLCELEGEQGDGNNQ